MNSSAPVVFGVHARSFSSRSKVGSHPWRKPRISQTSLTLTNSILSS